MRIVGGIYRHRSIEFPSDVMTRPTKDRVRESLFDSLGADIVNKNCLDLFAGSGSYGLEALSRGAKRCTFVDNSREAIKCIKNNCKSLNITNSSICTEEAEKYFMSLSGTEAIDVLFLDPPYALKVCQRLVIDAIDKKILNKDGIIIVETDELFTIDESIFKRIKRFKYGFIHLTILWR